MINGIVIINKEKGYTSHDVCAKVRGILRQKKVGHTGTLDPDATGVLPVCLGNATKLCDVLTDKTKEYIATILLGTVTDTLDIGGVVLSQNPVLVSEEEVRETVLSFLGKSMQIPPMYSALKQNGKKLYELARAGIEVERQPRPIEIFEIEILDINLPRVEIRILCSKGTYIRSLCDDIGKKLGCGACMTELVRLKVGAFDIAHAWTLAQIQEMAACGEEEVRRHIVPVEEMLSDYPEFKTTDAFSDKMLANGNWLPREQVATSGGDASAVLKDGMQVRMYSSTGNFTAIYQYVAVKNSLKNIKMFV